MATRGQPPGATLGKKVKLLIRAANGPSANFSQLRRRLLLPDCEVFVDGSVSGQLTWPRHHQLLLLQAGGGVVLAWAGSGGGGGEVGACGGDSGGCGIIQGGTTSFWGNFRLSLQGFV